LAERQKKRLVYEGCAWFRFVLEGDTVTVTVQGDKSKPQIIRFGRVPRAR
jgi:hypothetical protein